MSSPTISITKNKKALFDYEVLSGYEAGIQLTGAEVKSIRAGAVNLRGAHISLHSGRPLVIGMHITPYKGAISFLAADPTRERAIFLKRKDIEHLAGKIKEKGLTLIPTEIYLKGSLIKISIALARGRASYDKRDVLKKRTLDKEARKAMQIRL